MTMWALPTTVPVPPSLTDISFAAQNGQAIGVIGGTGSGKSTLINLIPPFL